ncbi:NB-ARC domain-containing protein, partial [Spirillospora sp. NPDC049652]
FDTGPGLGVTPFDGGSALAVTPFDGGSALAVSPLDGGRAGLVVTPSGAEVRSSPDEPSRNAAPGRVAPRPVNLPAAIGDFTGRETQMDRVRSRLARDAAERLAVPVLVVSGKGGVGKTALALQAAHDMEPDFPDGRLHVNLRGHDSRPTDPHDVLRRFLRAVGVEDGALPRDPDELGELFRSRTAGRRMLFLLDNAADEAQVRQLLPGSPTCSVLITSRSRLSGLGGAHVLNLEVFGTEEAVGLIEAIVGRERVAAEPEEAREITRLCGHLPLAVRVASARLASRPHWPLSRLTARLADEHRRLDELAFGDLEVRASVAVGHDGLDEAQRRAFRLLGLVQVPEFGAWVLGPLLGVPVGEAEDLVEALIDAQLLEVARSGRGGRLRLRFHDLVLLYARECLAEEPPQLQRAALARVSDAWLRLARLADSRAARTGTRLSWHSAPQASPESAPMAISGWTLHAPPASAIQGYSGLSESEAEEIVSEPLLWYDEERHALSMAVAQACEGGLTATAWGICHHLVEFFEVRGQYGDWERTHRMALRLCLEAGDAIGEATTRLGLARCLPHRDIDGALREAALAVTAFRDLGCHVAEAEALATRASVLRAAGRRRETSAALGSARDVLERATDGLTAVRPERELVPDQDEQERFAESAAVMGRSLDRAARCGTSPEQTMAARHLAIIKPEAEFEPRHDPAPAPEPEHEYGSGPRFGDHDEAFGLAERALAQAIVHLDSARELGRSSPSPHFLAQVHAWLAEALRMCGRDQEAHASYLTARTIYREIGNRSAADDLDRLMAALGPVAER